MAKFNRLYLELQGNIRAGKAVKGIKEKLPKVPNHRPADGPVSRGAGLILIIHDTLTIIEKGQGLRNAHSKAQRASLMVEVAKEKCRFERELSPKPAAEGCGCCQLDLALLYPIAPKGKHGNLRVIMNGGAPDVREYGVPETVGIDARYFPVPCKNRIRDGEIIQLPQFQDYGQNWWISKLSKM